MSNRLSYHEVSVLHGLHYQTMELEVKDSNGNILQDGDSVQLIKDLKVKGTSTTLKEGPSLKIFA
jgi:alkylphosphonate utilization operon protein PhnA